jgi:preprotein translocase subunit YajC|tara:strand:- start:65 stop:364 length:300 start_codon:yes stop_codon:yes gene_type:complete
MILLQAQSSGTASLIMFALIFLVMYFFMIRPQIRKQKKESQYRSQLKNNDKIVTLGGIHGKIIEVGKLTFVIEVHSGGKLKIEKTAVSLQGTTDLPEKK